MFENVDKFEDWLKINLKAEEFSLDSRLDDVMKQYIDKADGKYELKESETKSGDIEIYKYKVHSEDHDEENIEITYIF